MNKFYNKLKITFNDDNVLRPNYGNKSNVRVTNFFIKSFINCWYDEWLLENRKSDVNDRPRWKLIRSWT